MKPSLIDFINTSNKMLVCRCTAGSELCTRRSTKGQGFAFEKVLLISFINTRKSLAKHCIFVDCLLSSQAKLLETDEADEVFNVAENKTTSITDIFFRRYYLDLGSLQLHSWEIVAENFFKIFS